MKFMGNSHAQSGLTIPQFFDLTGYMTLVTGGCELLGNATGDFVLSRLDRLVTIFALPRS